jgi:16S rRNA (cytidine1402-2'-O)-methyltransferase
LAASGLPADTFAFLGFPPTRSSDRKRWFARAKSLGGTVVFFEAPHRIRRTLNDLLDAAGDCEVVVARELTKKHEQLVRGPISTVLSHLQKDQGEFTVVADIGLSTNNEELGASPIGSAMAESGLSRRQAIAKLARQHGLAPNEVYAALEEAKKSGE